MSGDCCIREAAALRVVKRGGRTIPLPKDVGEVEDLFVQCYGQYVKGGAKLHHQTFTEAADVDTIRKLRAADPALGPRGRFYGRTRFVGTGSRGGFRSLSAEKSRDLRKTIGLSDDTLALNHPMFGGTVVQDDAPPAIILHELIHGWTNEIFYTWAYQYPNTEYSGKPLMEAITHRLALQTNIEGMPECAYDAGVEQLGRLGLPDMVLERAMFGGEVQALERVLVEKISAANIKSVFYGFGLLQQGLKFATAPSAG